MPKHDMPTAPAFEVEIRRGNRAVEVPTLGEPEVGAARRPGVAAQRKARARRRAWLALGTFMGLALLAVGVAWWLGRPPTGALARVNGEYITAAQIDREILLNRALSALANNGQTVTDTRTATLERLISERMLAQAINRAGLDLTAADLDAAMTRLLASEHWPPDQLNTALARQGLSPADLRASIHDRVLINRYLDEVIDKGARDANQATALENTWRGQVESASKIERYGSPEAGDAPQSGRNAPDFTLRDLDGKAISLAGLRGRPVLVNFWATWCAPCRIEMPTLVNRYRQAQAAAPAGQGLELLAVAISSAPDTVAAFRKEFGITFPVLFDSDSQVLNLYRVGPIPTSFLIDRTGTIRWVQVGTWTDSLLADKLQLVP